MIKSIFEYVYNFVIDNVFTTLNLLLSYLIYRVINYIFKKLKIKNYTYDGDDENLNKIEIVWFSEKDISGNDKIYRFKDKKSSLLIFVNKNDISFQDKIKMLIFFTKRKNRFDKKLPEFLIKKYILPQLTLIKYNKNHTD